MWRGCRGGGSAVPPRSRPIHRSRQRKPLPALRRRPEKKRFPVGWVLLGLFIVAVIGGGVFARNTIVGLWPPSARLYEMVGLPVPVPGAGLVLHDVATERMTQIGRAHV